MLWLAHSTNAGRISGISAMPSLHIMFALLIGFYLWRINRAVGGALLVYAAIIFVGSVHLAWHYAVDGIAALVLAMITWRVSGWLVKDINAVDSNRPSTQTTAKQRSSARVPGAGGAGL
jgi:membrane-associated phospholipid phosphatase